MKKLLTLIPLLFLGCEQIVEIARKPEVNFVSYENYPSYSFDSDPIDTSIVLEDWEAFKARDDINILSYDNFSLSAYDVVYTIKGGESTKSGYFYHIKNMGRDTAYYVHVKVNTTEGEKSLFYKQIYLPNEEDSATVWLDHGEEFIGSASLDYESRK